MPPASRDFCRTILVLLAIACLVGGVGRRAHAAELLVGGAMVSITPDRPVALSGQMRTRIARNVESPVTATALALESRDGERVLDQAILVSCDLVAIREGIVDQVRQRSADRLPGFDTSKLILSATHTHTAPVMVEGRYDLAEADVMPPAEYVDFLAERVAQAAVEAWENRRPGRAGWGLGHAVTAYNRRVTYAGGRAQMYGPTNRADFHGLEGPEDQGVEVLFFWDEDETLIATAVNVACPAQAVEGRSAVNADFWHEVRELLRERHGEDLLVLGWTGASGDQSPRPMFRRAAEERMRRLRGLTELQEIARRIVTAWEEAYAGARQDIRTGAVLVHQVETIELTPREISTDEYAQAQARIAELADQPDNRWRVRWHQSVVDRYEQQRSGTAEPYRMELHVLRLGDVAIATNDFELFTEFGIQIKARSRALQTFLIQLAGPGSYVPTARAVQGGGYSAIAESNRVGPQGGQELVDRTVEAINGLWDGE